MAKIEWKKGQTDIKNRKIALKYISYTGVQHDFLGR
jgi:hypothetical protein